jgi:hypothetical protein
MKIIKYFIYAACIYVISVVALEGIIIVADSFGFENTRDLGLKILKTITFNTI